MDFCHRKQRYSSGALNLKCHRIRFTRSRACSYHQFGRSYGGGSSSSWGTNGAVATGILNTANNDYFEFAIDTSAHSTVALTFFANRKINNAPDTLTVYYGTSATPPGTLKQSVTLGSTNTFLSSGTISFTSGLSESGTTYFRIYASNSGNDNPGSDVYLDDVTFTGCGKPTLSKAFSPSTVVLNGTSTLTFTLTNPNTSALTGAAFSDTLPTGLEVAATPSASTTCSGSPTFGPTAGATVISFSGGTIPASSSCTAQVNIKATTVGPHVNTTGFISSSESGTNTGSNGSGSATLTAVQAPTIAKSFSANPITAGGTCTVKVDVTASTVGSYSNTSSAVTASVSGTGLTGNTASDTLVVKSAANPGMKLAKQVSTSTSGPWSPFRTLTPSTDQLWYRVIVENIGDVTLTSVTVTDPTVSLAGCTWSTSLASLASGDSSTCTVNPGTAQSGDHINTATAQGTHSGTTYTTTAAAEYVGVSAAGSPQLTLYKQISTSTSGPWSSSKSNPGSSVYYRFTVINTGNATVTSVAVTDNTLGSLSTCSFSSSLAAGAATACTYGPVTTNTGAGTYTNTATATGSSSTTSSSSASYIVSGATAVLLATFTAHAVDDGILLEWQTAQELAGIGFNLYRASSIDGHRQRLNLSMLPVKNLGRPIGADYRLLDGSALPRVGYSYWLEVVMQSGLSRYFGPVQASQEKGQR